jgi:formylmethanofuran dehydrogenase subunit E
MLKQRILSVSLLASCFFMTFSLIKVRAETPEEWVKLGQRVHGGFGTYIALGIRIGLDANQRLKAQARDLDVTYQDGQNSPCPCVVDGIMIATVATPGQNSLHVLPSKATSDLFGVVFIKHKKTGQSLRYTIPDSARVLLDVWNKDKKGRERYDAVMNASQESLFKVEKLP